MHFEFSKLIQKWLSYELQLHHISSEMRHTDKHTHERTSPAKPTIELTTNSLHFVPLQTSSSLHSLREWKIKLDKCETKLWCSAFFSSSECKTNTSSTHQLALKKVVTSLVVEVSNLIGIDPKPLLQHAPRSLTFRRLLGPHGAVQKRTWGAFSRSLPQLGSGWCG